MLHSAFDQRVHISDSTAATADPTFKKKIIDYRRCIVLAVVGSTPIESSALASVALDGYISNIKEWLDDILSPPLGMLYRCTMSMRTDQRQYPSHIFHIIRFCGYAFAFACKHY